MDPGITYYWDRLYLLSGESWLYLFFLGLFVLVAVGGLSTCIGIMLKTWLEDRRLRRYGTMKIVVTCSTPDVRGNEAARRVSSEALGSDNRTEPTLRSAAG